MRYEGRVFRPPSEAFSLIVQVTVGCSNNTCKFCDMYKEKRFHLRPLEDVLYDFDLARRAYSRIDRVFLADGDALIRKCDDLLAILEHIKQTIPECTRVTSYASPQSLLFSKTPAELEQLKKAGLDMVYIGLESGSDSVLKLMDKRVTPGDIITAVKKAKSAGIKVSVTAISGLGGQDMTEEHAIKTGEALSEMNPEYIGLLTLMVERGTPLYDWVKEGSFKLLTPEQVLTETKLMLESTNSPGSVFRMNHASNYLSLKGTLNFDTPRLLRELDEALLGVRGLRSEYMRGL